MRKVAVIAIPFLLWSHLAVAVDFPFAPLPNVPDYVATFSVKPSSKIAMWRTNNRVVTHHDGWARIDSEIDGRYRITTYAKIAEPLTFSLRRGERIISFAILRGIEARKSQGWGGDPFKTEDRDTVAGETCDIWNIDRYRYSHDIFPELKRESNRFSCISQDGIELRNWFVSSDSNGPSAEITSSVVRRPVQAGEVTPPADWFELKTWLAEDAPSDAAPSDAIVRMEVEQPNWGYRIVKTRVVRRHHPWTLTEDVHADGKRTGTVVNMTQRLVGSFEIDPNGQVTQLALSPLSAENVRERERRPTDMDKQETVLGMTCTWFDMLPRTLPRMDTTHHTCRTEDGLVLKDLDAGRAHRIQFIAVDVQRARVPLSDVSPAAMLARSNWGLPE